MTQIADLTGKKAIVTGGASGIGLATARQLIALGAEVMIADFSPEVENVAAEIGAKSFRVNVTNDEEVKAMSWTTFVTGCTQPELVQYLKERRLYVNEPVCGEEEV